MDQLKKRILQWIDKYKYIALIVCLGIVLMLWPNTKKNEISFDKNSVTVSQIDSLELRIENIVKYIYGVGEVKVLLTESQGEEIHFQQNEDIQINDGSQSTRTDTVITSDNQRNENGLIQQINPPKYMGAVVVCKGADDPVVKLAVIDAVSKVTGLRADKISVLKMK